MLYTVLITSEDAFGALIFEAGFSMDFSMAFTILSSIFLPDCLAYSFSEIREHLLARWKTASLNPSSKYIISKWIPLHPMFSVKQYHICLSGVITKLPSFSSA